MKLTARQYAQTLYEVLQDTKNLDHGQVLDNFADVLRHNNDLSMFEDIAAEFEKIELTAKGIKIAEVTTASPLAKQSEKELQEYLNQAIKGKVELKKKIDEKLIGGVVIKLDDQIMDASVKNSLDQLKKHLSE